MLHCEIGDEVENDDKQKDEHFEWDLFNDIEDLFTDNVVIFDPVMNYRLNSVDVSRCRGKNCQEEKNAPEGKNSYRP